MRISFLVLVVLTSLSAGCAEDPQPSEAPLLDPAAVTQQPEKSTDESNSQNSEEKSVSTQPTQTDYNKLTDDEEYVLLHKGTEPGGVGEYTDTEDAGTYICRRCNAQLYRSDQKFHSNCGWPAFDDEIEGAVTRVPENDGTRRTEIVCANCQGHLGHVFLGERFTEKNTRHCVNSISMILVPEGQEIPATIRLESTSE